MKRFLITAWFILACAAPVLSQVGPGALLFQDNGNNLGGIKVLNVTPASSVTKSGSKGTINLSVGSVTSVTASSPISSSGGATPNISCASCLTSAAPTTASYLLQVSNVLLPNSQDMSALGTGVVKNTTGTGVQSIVSTQTCTNQAMTALSQAFVKTCSTITSSFVDTTVLNTNNYSLTGNSTQIETASGAFTSGNCVKFDTASNVTAAGNPCGTVTSVATTSPITGGTITGSGTIACATCTTNAAALTSNLPMIGAGGQAAAVGTRLGTTTQFATASGAFTQNDLATFDSASNLIDAGFSLTSKKGTATIAATASGSFTQNDIATFDGSGNVIDSAFSFTSKKGTSLIAAAASGGFISGNCLKSDTASNIVDAGVCGSGTVTSVTASSPITSTGGTTPNIACPTCLDPESNAIVYEEFVGTVGGSLVSGFYNGSYVWGLNTFGNAGVADNATQTNGRINVSGDGALSGYITLGGTLANADLAFIVTKNPTIKVSFGQLGGNNGNTTIINGLVDSTINNANPTNGLFFRFTQGGIISAVARKANVETTLSTGITAANGVLHTFRLVVTGGGTSVEVWADGADIGAIATNIPTVALFGAMNCGSATSTANGQIVDYFYVSQTR